MTTTSRGANFSAANWTQLTLTLCVVEKEIGVIRLKADERVLKEEERVGMVAKKREELVAEFNKRKEDRLYEYTRQLENICGMANHEIDEHVAAKANAEVRIKNAEICAQKADEQAKELEKEVERLYGLYNKVCAEHDQKLEGVRKETDERVRNKVEESNRVVRDTGIYAQQVQTEGMQFMTELEVSMRTKRKDHEKDSLGRSRFKELYDMATNYGTIPEREVRSAKTNILQDWHNSWQSRADYLVQPPDCISPGFRDVSSSLSNHENIGAEDILDTVAQRTLFSSSSPAPDTARSKERALSRAAEYKRERLEKTQIASLGRPKTAPG